MTDSAFPRTDAAAEALSAGRLVLSHSFRLHRPRGAFCHAGWCQQCRVTLPDGRIALACQTSETPAAPRGGWRRLMGRIAERLPPWFYEQHLLAPRALRQFYLERLRRLSAAPALPRSLPPITGQWRDRRCEVLVVGGGIAGMTAALSHHAAGRDVLLVESEASLGGRARFQRAYAAELARLTGAERDAAASARHDLRRPLRTSPRGASHRPRWSDHPRLRRARRRHRRL